MTTIIMNEDDRITVLAYEKINEKYSKAKYLGLECIMDMKTGFINATKFCAFYNKEFKDFSKRDRYKNLIDYISSSGTYVPELSFKNMSGSYELRGTYIHHILLLDISSWISPEAYIKATHIVNNFLIKEKEDEIRNAKILLGQKDDKIDELKLMLIESDKRREESERRSEKMLQEMKDQNEKTHFKLDDTKKTLDNTEKMLEKSEIDNDKIKTTLHRVETRVEKLVEEVVPPAKQVSLHEEFGIMRLNDKNGKWQYKIYCSQKRCVEQAKRSIKKDYPKAEMLLEIKPNPNSKNLLHKIKELYGYGKNAKFKISYNSLNLNVGITEDELKKTVEEVFDDKKNFATQ
jgi:hypothetical protein